MNADEIVRALKECGDCDNCPYYSCWIDEETGDPADACNDGRLFKDILSLIESLQSQLAEAKRRTEKALGYIKKIFGCDDCVHNDDTNYETCKSCNIYDKWQWRGDAEEGDAE